MGLTKEECSVFAAVYLRTMDVGAAAAAIGRADGAEIRVQEAVEREIARLREGLTLTEEDVLRRVGEIAFGRANDCVKLALSPECDIDALDLTLLSELRRTEKGLVEIKLLDRFAALQYLGEHIKGRTDPAAEFFAALGAPESEGA